MHRLVAILLLVGAFVSVKADTPANCTLGDLHGTWHFYLYSGNHDRHVDCSKTGQAQAVISVTFSGDNMVVMDRTGAQGHFNLIYNQGFEAIIQHRKFFAFFAWKQLDANHSQYWCDHTMTGWAHDSLGNDWTCFTAIKKNTKFGFISANSMEGVIVENPVTSPAYQKLLQTKYETSKQFVSRLNKAQSSWLATDYPDLSKMTYKQVLMRSGYGNGPISRPSNPNKAVYARLFANRKLPDSFDWRKVDGRDFVSPIRNQGDCGSCYAFASMAMLESRVRIMTNDTQKPVYSPQDVMSCGHYSQGCNGGFPYLVAGKYAQDYGVVEESCYPYQGKDTPTCAPATPSCQRTYVAEYEYVGGYYGACTEENMKEALVANGPIVVGIEVYADLQQYKGGIYHHVTSVESSRLVGFNPFQLTNHAVLVVGYGADLKTGEKFWIVKNSWGEHWGESGYFRIRRGNDEVAIESLAMQSSPIPHIG